MIDLTERQALILRLITEAIRARGYPPTVRELLKATGGKSTNGIADHLAALIRKGYLLRDGMKSRGIRLPEGVMPMGPTAEIVEAPGVEMIQVPVLARIRAGKPLVSASEVLTTYTLAAEDLPGEGMVFALRIQGQTMSGEGILPGDDIIFRARTSAPPSGTLCAVMIGEEAIVRRIDYGTGYVRFLAANPMTPPVMVRTSDFSEAAVLGVAVRLWRGISSPSGEPA